MRLSTEDFLKSGEEHSEKQLEQREFMTNEREFPIKMGGYFIVQNRESSLIALGASIRIFLKSGCSGFSNKENSNGLGFDWYEFR
jgi:hypothetical protein